MRRLVHATLLTVAFFACIPSAAHAAPTSEASRKRAVDGNKERETFILIVWGAMATALAVGVVIGVGMVRRSSGRWYSGQDLSKAPWEQKG